MKLKHEKIEIPREGDPFINCKLNRKQYADILTTIVDKYADGFVLAINNEWGTGKTTFVKMWAQQLINEGYETFYFNAWENDFEANVLVALISELVQLDDIKSTPLKDKLLEKAAPLTKSFFIGLLKSLIKKYAGEEFFSQALEETTDSVKDEIQKQIDEYLNRKNSIAEFKKLLEIFVKSNSPDKPIIFIIDELDRCRPSYSVEVLEIVKHLFSVKGFVFVLSVDKKQLGHAVRGFYGSENINAEEYLRRFIDIEYSLPDPEDNLFCKYLYDYYGFDEFIEHPIRVGSRELYNEKTTLIKFSSLLFKSLHLTLRMQEKIFAHARLALLLFKENYYLSPMVFIFLIYLKEIHTNIYQQISLLNLSLQGLIDEVDRIFESFIKISSIEEINQIVLLEANILKFYHNDIVRHNNVTKKLWVEGEENSLTLSVKSKIGDKYDLNTAINNIENHSPFSNIHLTYLTKKIDLLDPVTI